MRDFNGIANSESGDELFSLSVGSLRRGANFKSLQLLMGAATDDEFVDALHRAGVAKRSGPQMVRVLEPATRQAAPQRAAGSAAGSAAGRCRIRSGWRPEDASPPGGAPPREHTAPPPDRPPEPPEPDSPRGLASIDGFCVRTLCGREALTSHDVSSAYKCVLRQLARSHGRDYIAVDPCRVAGKMSRSRGRARCCAIGDLQKYLRCSV